MTKIDDGGTAFPFIEWKSPDGMIGIQLEPGMSLRDHFAGQALAAIIQADGIQFACNTHDHAALAYRQADAMIAARKSEGQ